MAFSVGSVLTVDALNNINVGVYLRTTTTPGGAWSYWPSTTGIYSRNVTRQCYYSITTSVSNGRIQLQKLSGSTWTIVFDKSWGWFASEAANLNYGIGWYRVYHYGTFSPYDLRLYWGKNNNTAGSNLRYYNSYTGSSYSTGSVITAAMANSGRVGTV